MTITVPHGSPNSFPSTETTKRLKHSNDLPGTYVISCSGKITGLLLSRVRTQLRGPGVFPGPRLVCCAVLLSLDPHIIDASGTGEVDDNGNVPVFRVLQAVSNAAVSLSLSNGPIGERHPETGIAVDAELKSLKRIDGEGTSVFAVSHVSYSYVSCLSGWGVLSLAAQARVTVAIFPVATGPVLEPIVERLDRGTADLLSGMFLHHVVSDSRGYESRQQDRHNHCHDCTHSRSPFRHRSGTLA